MMPAGRLLDDLNGEQRRAVTSDASTLAILAGAGSGKTRVLTRRVAWLAATGRVEPARCLVATFTRKAARELSNRLGALGAGHPAASGTFHSLALGQLRRRLADRGAPAPVILERKARLLIPILGGSEGPLEAAEVAAEIEWAKSRLIIPERYEAEALAAGRQTGRPPGELAGLFARYEREKSRRGLRDFDDLILHLADALEADADFAAATRARFRYLFVDEFQDLTPAQFRLLQAWLGGRPDLCVVGDDDQAIYGFAGADPSYLVDFPHHFPGASVLRLEENHRSSPEILAAAGAALGGGLRRKRPARSTAPPGALPVVCRYSNEGEEAAGIARALRDEHSGGRRWSMLAVLYRTNAQSAPFEASLRAAGIPFRVRGAGRFLDRPEVRSALELLRAREAATPRAGLAAHLLELGAWGAEGTEERRAHAEALTSLAEEYLDLPATEPTPTVDGFWSHLGATLAGEDESSPGEGVDLLTFHKSKGLEWDVVFVVGVERGLVPIGYAETVEARAEERRLLHVAITRARRVVALSWAQRRALGARTVARQPSPYLREIEAVLQAAASSSPIDVGNAVAAARARLAKEAGRRPRRIGRLGGSDLEPDPAVLRALMEWRRGKARASGVPAFVIFHDATLAALAEARPASRDELLAIPGIGPLKAERYGHDLLSVVGACA